MGWVKIGKSQFEKRFIILASMECRGSDRQIYFRDPVVAVVCTSHASVMIESVSLIFVSRLQGGPIVTRPHTYLRVRVSGCKT